MSTKAQPKSQLTYRRRWPLIPYTVRLSKRPADFVFELGTGRLAPRHPDRQLCDTFPIANYIDSIRRIENARELHYRTRDLALLHRSVTEAECREWLTPLCVRWSPDQKAKIPDIIARAYPQTISKLEFIL